MNKSSSSISLSIDALDKDASYFDMHEKYISSHIKRTPFHSIAYARIIRREYGIRSKVVSFYKENLICGIVILYDCPTFPFGKKTTELVFSGSYGGILFSKNVLQKDLIEILKQEFNNRSLLEIKLTKKYAEQLTNDMTSIYVNYNLLLSESINDIWTKNVDQKARNQVRKASKSGLEFSLYGVEGLNAFYDVYRITMKGLGSPCLSYGFFESLTIEFASEVKISIVKYKGKPISVLFNILALDKMHNVWAGSLFEYRKFCPNYMNYWELIKWCKSNNVSNFDFGRSITKSTHESFKKQWGAEKTDLFYYDALSNKHCVAIDTKSTVVFVFNKIWRSTPWLLTNVCNKFFLKRTG